MAVCSPEVQQLEVEEIDRHPLLMESPGAYNVDHECSVVASRSNAISSPHLLAGSSVEPLTSNAAQPSTLTTHAPSPSSELPSTSASSSSRNRSFLRRSANGYSHRDRSPLNSGLWISIELVVTICQIVASVVVLSLSRNEKPQAPLFAWVVGYAAGCVATLPLLYWRYNHWNRSTPVREPTNAPQGSSQSTAPADSTFISISIPDVPRQEQPRSFQPGRGLRMLGTRLNAFADHFKMALDCFFAVWFVVGNVWIFGGHASSSEAPNLYRLCIVFLTFSCIGYAMPFILCATICCCLPCIISILGFREDMGHTRGATAESINALPTYKFKLKSTCKEDNENSGDVGILAMGTEKERILLGEDAVCPICLAKYADDEELRELTCQHLFHVECVDKWLKINATCPLCKAEVGESATAASGQRQGERRSSSGSDADPVANGLF